MSKSVEVCRYIVDRYRYTAIGDRKINERIDAEAQWLAPIDDTKTHRSVLAEPISRA
ncbi:MAG: hypothetical protein HC856_06575 [Pseudanabaena sp. RU_4_16]|nr:hypothetical protein [Pseudanabaena sp. RU_4_16]